MKTQSVWSSCSLVVGRCCERGGEMRNKLARSIVVCMRCIQGVGCDMNGCSRVYALKQVPEWEGG